MSLRTGNESLSGTPPTNFTVLRLKRDILRRSSVGAIFTNRSKSAVSIGSNQAAGVDAAFAFFQNVTMGGYYAKTSTPADRGDATSYQARFEYGADRYGARVAYLHVGDDFNPEVGFVQRDDLRRTFASLRFSPRPRNIKGVRKVTWEGTFEYILKGAGTLETRQQSGRFNVELDNSDQFTVSARKDYELLVQPFAVAPGVTIPVGGYGFGDALVEYGFGQQRRLSGSLSASRGRFYNGTITTFGYSGGRIFLTKQLALAPSVSVSRVDLPAGRFDTPLVRTRADFAFSPRMFTSALLQYSSREDSVSTNLRFRWEYTPGSEFFAVYTDERDTLGPGFPQLRNRAFVLKIGRLFQF